MQKSTRNQSAKIPLPTNLPELLQTLNTGTTFTFDADQKLELKEKRKIENLLLSGRYLISGAAKDLILENEFIPASLMRHAMLLQHKKYTGLTEEAFYISDEQDIATLKHLLLESYASIPGTIGSRMETAFIELEARAKEYTQMLESLKRYEKQAFLQKVKTGKKYRDTDLSEVSFWDRCPMYSVLVATYVNSIIDQSTGKCRQRKAADVCAESGMNIKTYYKRLNKGLKFCSQWIAYQRF